MPSKKPPVAKQFVLCSVDTLVFKMKWWITTALQRLLYGLIKVWIQYRRLWHLSPKERVRCSTTAPVCIDCPPPPTEQSRQGKRSLINKELVQVSFGWLDRVALCGLKDSWWLKDNILILIIQIIGFKLVCLLIFIGQDLGTWAQQKSSTRCSENTFWLNYSRLSPKQYSLCHVNQTALPPSLACQSVLMAKGKSKWKLNDFFQLFAKHVCLVSNSNSSCSLERSKKDSISFKKDEQNLDCRYTSGCLCRWI